MDYKKTSDMLALALFGMLVGLIFLYVPVVPSLDYTDFRNICNTFGILSFTIFSVMLLIVLIRWAYRVSFGTIRKKAEVMDAMESNKRR